MRSDVFVDEVLAKCDVLRRAGFWPSEQRIRPRAWIENFDAEDRRVAALLLDKFTFYDQRLTDALLLASYNSIGDGMQKGPRAPAGPDLLRSLNTAIFTPVKGEKPNPTDSGNLVCRKARQLLHIPEQLILDTPDAVVHASKGGTVVFLDDFVGSGDQFINTWTAKFGSSSFEVAQPYSKFVAIYITLVTTDFGIANIQLKAPEVAICATHVLESKSNIAGLSVGNARLEIEIRKFLEKYSVRLTPKDAHIAKNTDYRQYGYKKLGLMLGFEHSIPDATLPIFWSSGIGNWEPLIERS